MTITDRSTAITADPPAAVFDLTPDPYGALPHQRGQNSYGWSMTDTTDYDIEPGDYVIAVGWGWPTRQCALTAAARLLYRIPATDIAIEEDPAGYGWTDPQEARQAARRHHTGCGGCANYGHIDPGGSAITGRIPPANWQHARNGGRR